MKPAFLLAPLALAACSTTEPGVVLKPIPVACVKAEQIPAEPAQVASKLTGNAAVDIGILAQSALELRIALREARALLIGCRAD